MQVEIVLVWSVIVATLLRLGLLALTSCFFVFNLLQVWPLTLDTSAWYSTESMLAAAILVGLAGLALFGARGGALAWRRALANST